MALKSPAFRKKFPLLVTGSLLAMQPLASQFVVAAEQYDCAVSATGGWACAPKTPAAALPPRPVHDGSAVSAAGEAPAQNGSTSDTGAKPVLVTDAKGRGLKSRSEDYSHLDWVPREKLTAAQLAETGPYCSGSYIEPIRPGMNDKTNKSDAPTFIGAKASRYNTEDQVGTLAGDVVLRCDPDRRVVFANDGFQTVFGLAPDAVMGESVDALLARGRIQPQTKLPHDTPAEPLRETPRIAAIVRERLLAGG